MAVFLPYKETMVTYSNAVANADSEFGCVDANVTYIHSNAEHYVNTIELSLSDKDGIVKPNCNMTISEEEIPALIELLQYVQDEITKWNEKHAPKNGD
ncbi:MAG: hypothetical protein K6F33_00275 [Bacteroidales bacterium]|nr:hypothetical protein [Bacteroidales bacterium]